MNDNEPALIAARAERYSTAESLRYRVLIWIAVFPFESENFQISRYISDICFVAFQSGAEFQSNTTGRAGRSIFRVTSSWPGEGMI
jgi:hypothetical protein